jgi:type VI secretion system secreted protein Hcp
MNRNVLLPALVLLFLTGAVPAADSAYMTVTDRNGAVIAGGVTIKGHEKSMQVLGFSHEIVSPRDPATGQATGKRQHKPLLVTKPLDQSTPLLFQALVRGDTLKSVEIKFYSTGVDGREVNTYTILLTNVHITSLSTSLPDVRDPQKAGYSESDALSFVYEKITWTWVQGNITATDDWIAPVA